MPLFRRRRSIIECDRWPDRTTWLGLPLMVTEPPRTRPAPNHRRSGKRRRLVQVTGPFGSAVEAAWPLGDALFDPGFDLLSSPLPGLSSFAGGLLSSGGLTQSSSSSSSYCWSAALSSLLSLQPSSLGGLSPSTTWARVLPPVVTAMVWAAPAASSPMA